jgi:hypothetical protein
VWHSIHAARDVDEVLAVGEPVARLGRGDRPAERLRRELDHQLHRQGQLAGLHLVLDRLERAQEDEDGLGVLLAEGTVELVRHHRKERGAVALDPLAEGAQHLAVGPVAEAGLDVAGDVLRLHEARHAEVLVEPEAALPLGAGLLGDAERGLQLRVAAEAVHDVVHEVLAAREALRRGGDLLGGGLALLGLHQGEPGHRDAEQDHHRADHRHHRPRRLGHRVPTVVDGLPAYTIRRAF